MIYTDETYVKGILRPRGRDAHKGTFGRILIYAGSVGMAGAAILCGRAALRTGAGLVSFLLPAMDSPIYPVLQTAVPEATCKAYSEGMDFNEYDAIACGCGIGQSETAAKIVKDILLNYSNTLVLDADALNLISKDPALAEAVANSGAARIMTPHPGEAKRLLGSCAGIAGLTGRKNAVCDLAAEYHCIAVLKGAGTLIAVPENASFTIYENTTGNPGMATGGSGDVLTGIIASLAGQKYAAPEAARLGVYLHGKAGDIAADALGEMSVTAGDIAAFIPDALKLYYPK